MKKTISINEKKAYKAILERLDDRYTLAYADYRDDIPASLVQKCVDTKDDIAIYEEDMWNEARHMAAAQVITDIAGRLGYTDEQIELFCQSDEYRSLRDEIFDRDESDPEGEAAKNTVMYGYIRIHSNYDCWLPLWEQGALRGRGTALASVMAALSLNPWLVRQEAARQGVATEGPFPNLESRNGKEVVDYKAFVRTLVETPNYGNWAFFGRLDLGLMMESGFDTSELVIPKGTTCAMFNWWNGGGSLDFCETLRPLPLKELERRLKPYHDTFKLVVDEKENKEYGYVPCDVYGGRVGTTDLLED